MVSLVKRHAGLMSALIVVCLFGIMSGYSEWNNSSFVPFNGHFQNYWTLRRLSIGEVPFLDFPVYLGSAHLYIAFPFYELLGGGFRASTAIHNALAGITMALSTVIICRLVRLSWISTIIMTAGMWQLFIVITTGWNSIIGFRSFLPVLVGLVVYKFIPDKNKYHAILFGLVMGACPFWSNDYGFPCLIGMFIVLALYSHIRMILISTVTSIFSFVAVMCLVSMGHPYSWLESTIVNSQTQGWYFNPDAEHKIYSLYDLPWSDPSFIITSFISLCLLTVILKNKYQGNPNQKNILGLFCIILCGLGGFLLTCIGGTYQERYIIPIWRIILPICIYFFIWVIQFLHIKVKTPFKNINGIIQSFICLLFTGTILFSSERIFLNTISDSGLVFSESLKVNTWPEIIEAEKIGKRLYENNISVGSNYSSVVSIANKIIQPVSPYIIHALGKKGENDFIDNLKNNKFNVWETLDHERIFWGLWNVRMSWKFHKYLFMNRYPYDRTAWTLLWKERETPVIPQEVKCSINGNKLKIENESPEPFWIDVHVNVEASFTPGIVPLIGKNKLITINENRVNMPGTYMHEFITNRWTAPLESGVIELPTISSLNEPSEIALKSWPENRSNLSIKSCSAYRIVPVKETKIINKENPYIIDGSSEKVVHVSIDNIIIFRGQNPFYLLSAKVGDIVHFSNKETREVIEQDSGFIAIMSNNLDLGLFNNLITITSKPVE